MTAGWWRAPGCRVWHYMEPGAPGADGRPFWRSLCRHRGHFGGLELSAEAPAPCSTCSELLAWRRRRKGDGGDS